MNLQTSAPSLNSSRRSISTSQQLDAINKHKATVSPTTFPAVWAGLRAGISDQSGFQLSGTQYGKNSKRSRKEHGHTISNQATLLDDLNSRMEQELNSTKQSRRDSSNLRQTSTPQQRNFSLTEVQQSGPGQDYSSTPNYALFDVVHGFQADPKMAAKPFDMELHAHTIQMAKEREERALREYEAKQQEIINLRLAQDREKMAVLVDERVDDDII